MFPLWGWGCSAGSVSDGDPAAPAQPCVPRSALLGGKRGWIPGTGMLQVTGMLPVTGAVGCQQGWAVPQPQLLRNQMAQGTRSGSFHSLRVI